MPSHKHKKKKKSHKRSKRHSSSSSEDTCSPFRVPLSDADSDESSNIDCLTPLVRRTYVNYLKEALTVNFQECASNLTQTNTESIQESVYKWSSVLEQRALKTCMISELYRKSMVSVIRQIKTSTNDKRLYIEDKTISRLKSKIPVSNVSQTDPSEFTQDLETQTDFLEPSSLSELTKPSTPNRPYDPAIDFDDSNSSDGGVSSSLGSKQSQLPSIISGNQDICKISSTSDILNIDELLNQEDRVNAVGTEDGLSCRSSISFNKCKSGEIDNSISKVECVLEDLEITQHLNAHDTMNSDTNDYSKIIKIKKRPTSIENASQNSKTNLDDRLSALGLLSDSGDNLTHLSGKSKKSNWYAEEIAQSCNLTRILMRMTTKQREKVLKKIKDLFGEDNNFLTELSEENISVCRKRIASVVVMELTPIYQSKRIASRHLFKFLAKKITRSIMEKSLAPDTKIVRWRVKKYFEDGKIIMSEADCT